MLTGPEVLQCQCFILEPSVFIPGGGILEPSNLRVLKLAKSYKAVLLGTASKSSWWSAVATFHLKNLYILIKGSLGGETSVLRTFRMSGKELVKERVSEGKS